MEFVQLVEDKNGTLVDLDQFDNYRDNDIVCLCRDERRFMFCSARYCFHKPLFLNSQKRTYMWHNMP